MKTILIGAYYQLMSFLRVKKALFFAFFFPSFIYIIFSMIWGVEDEDYRRFLLTGVIVMTTASDGLFSIGNVIVDYYQNGLIRFFRITPYSFSKHILSLIISRFFIVVLSMFILFVVAYLLKKSTFTYVEIAHIIAGVVLCFFIFTYLGLIIAEITKDQSSQSGILNFIFYGVIFLSDTFYPLTELNASFNMIVLLNPITPALELARGNLHLMPCIIWILALILAQTISFKIQLKR